MNVFESDIALNPRQGDQCCPGEARGKIEARQEWAGFSAMAVTWLFPPITDWGVIA
jgi:hypothetical protein